jgi:Zn-finger nucleic acid-binding protein
MTIFEFRGNQAMKCPVCKEVDLVMSDRQGVEIDYCPKCRGVWLDRGELDKIIERSTSNQPAQSQQPQPPQYPPQSQYPYPPQSDHDSPHGYNNKRKKSWLGDLFD